MKRVNLLIWKRFGVLNVKGSLTLNWNSVRIAVPLFQFPITRGSAAGLL